MKDKTIKLLTLKLSDRNPRTIKGEAFERLCESIKRDPEFMVLRPIVVDEENVILGGNQRYRACRHLGMAEVPAEWIKVANGLTPEQRKRFVVVDNAPDGMAGEWDEDLLAACYDLAELKDLGFDKLLAEIEAAGAGETGVDAEPQVNRAEELRKKWGVERGQVWTLGAHRLMCGDSTLAEDVGRLMNGDTAGAEVFDPPWDAEPLPKMALTSPAPTILAFSDGGRIGDVVRLMGAPIWAFAWDCVSSWYTPNRPLRRIKLALWYGSDVGSYKFDGAHYGDAGEEREVCNPRGSYTFRPDPRGKHLSDLFSTPITRLHADGSHQHEKPVDWIRLLVGNCTYGLVVDGFCGSGTTIIACEQLGRKCRAIEISPGYVAVALQRWADATGKQPKRITANAPLSRAASADDLPPA
jgi:hypothetical protein